MSSNSSLIDSLTVHLWEITQTLCAGFFMCGTEKVLRELIKKR